jgi:fucose permease
VGIFVLLIADSSIAIALTAMVTGLGLSSLYPAFIAMLSHWFGEAGIRVGGVMFSLASLGGAVVPWLVGALSTQFGSLRVGLLLPLFSALLMLVLYVAYGSYRPATGRLTQAASN